MVQALEGAIAMHLAQSPGHRLGFLLPLVELMDNHRLGATNSAKQLGAEMAAVYLRRTMSLT
jgi:hypothetical protein